LPNHAQLLSAVEGDVVQLGDWYQGQRVRTLLKNNRDVVQPWIDGRAERTGILGRTRARTLMESGEDDRKESSDTLAKGVAGGSSPRRGDLSLFRLYFGLIPSAKPTSERCVVDEEGW
jgi:hypothetical protein